MIKRYGVLDADGIKMSTITADSDAVDGGWYPGYGAALIDEGENPPDPPKAQPAPKPKSFAVLPELSIAMSNGDQIDFKTLQVTKAAIATVDIP